MQKIIRAYFILILFSIITACSDEKNNVGSQSNDHVWEQQTETINKAKEVEGLLMDSAENTRNAIEY